MPQKDTRTEGSPPELAPRGTHAAACPFSDAEELRAAAKRQVWAVASQGGDIVQVPGGGVTEAEGAARTEPQG